GFYRRHVKDFAKIALPLSNLTKKDKPFAWDLKCQLAFETLKKCLTEAPILVKPDMSKPFTLITDASDVSVGAVLTQREGSTGRVIGYFSKKLSPTETRYSATDKEALGVLLACRQFDHFLWGGKFDIFTDHQPLTSVFVRKTKSPRMARWSVEMREYNYKIHYIKGKDNVVADALSRPVGRIIVDHPNESFLGHSKQEIAELQRSEQRWAEIIKFCEKKKVPKVPPNRYPLHKFNVIEGILYYSMARNDGSLRWSLVVPQQLRNKALRFAHESVGHLGQKKTITNTEEFFFWENLRTDCVNWVNSCVTCQRTKGTKGLTHHWREVPQTTHPLERISIDLTDMVAGTEGLRFVLSVIDGYSRFVRLYPLKTKGAEGVVKALEEFIRAYGKPEAILSDNGGEFVNRTFRKFREAQGITHMRSTPYHPQGNSVVERMHATLKKILATLCEGSPNRWPRLLPTCESIMNQSVHSTTGCQPHFAFLGRYPRRRVGARLPEFDIDQEDLKLAHESILVTSQRQLQAYRKAKNVKRPNDQVTVTSWVWVRLETGKPGTSRKLNEKWAGPYEVVEINERSGTYVLKDLQQPNSQICRAADKIKPYIAVPEEYLVDDRVVVPEVLTEPVNEETEEEDQPEGLPPEVPRPVRLRKKPKRLVEVV
ncbi:MAG: RNase H-like domain-containing protein, partial [Cyanobacteria bacterium J06553_1]